MDDLLANETVGTRLAVGLVDLDFFKQVNDRYGHPLGDQVLRRVVDVLQAELPAEAFCARYGGEEFVLVLPQVSKAEVVGLCEAARERIERYPWQHLARGLRLTISISIGVAYEADYEAGVPAGPARRAEALASLVGSADQLLYLAKQSGHNAVAFWSGDGVALAGEAARHRAAPGGPNEPAWLGSAC